MESALKPVPVANAGISAPFGLGQGLRSEGIRYRVAGFRASGPVLAWGVSGLGHLGTRCMSPEIELEFGRRSHVALFEA